ncbi:ATP-binding protein [Roseisolibacter sp. H3M3-2]|uniref:ATP-binding protein n=1 Tax=Roseisolibacter sp. H3M3-2 TaxID=3031323 RepID=UPI0023DAD49E|nr:ATP-binding protein [Roseisolibacter sp. H3M3-2]MDF1501328.1 ATP-binding protein [Roseisolibacter sp. H3M3-2]
MSAARAITPSSGRRRPFPLVADQQFILATRDTGYRSISTAVAELIDNALQAGATTIHIFVREALDADAVTGTSRRRVSIAVLDNGSGMTAAALRTALQFGGSDRFNDRSGAGRFGMGLPNSSVSQSGRIELYSWRDGKRALYSYLDVHEIARGTMREVPAPATCAVPQWVPSALAVTGYGMPASGTFVLWPQCDRLPFRKASTVRTKLIGALGRTYRHAIRNGTKLLVDGAEVPATNPLMDWGSVAEKHGPATQYGEELRYEFKVPSSPSRTSVVRVRFTVLPIRQWAPLPLEVRRELGVIGGAGVSVVRAGREVDFGWHLMGGKRRENYDDWWRCEVRFEPELDEYFGVTHSKQGITPHPLLQDALEADLERIARTLNVLVRREFVRVSTGENARVTAQKSASPGPSPILAMRAVKIANEREPFLPTSDRRIRRYRIRHAPLTSARFFVTALEKGELEVTLNSEHPLYGAVTSTGAGSRELFDFILLAAARAEVATRPTSFATPHARPEPGSTPDAAEQFLEAWSDALAAYLSGRT